MFQRNGNPFIAFTPIVDVTISVYIFGKNINGPLYFCCNFRLFNNKSITKKLWIFYFIGDNRRVFLASVFVKYIIRIEVHLGATAPNYSYPLSLIFAVEVLASASLMTVILVVVYTHGLRGFGGLAIGSIVGFDIFFLAFISGASMNPARSLAPALLSGVLGNLWLYWTATFVGTSIISFVFRKRFMY